MIRLRITTGATSTSTNMMKVEPSLPWRSNSAWSRFDGVGEHDEHHADRRSPRARTCDVWNASSSTAPSSTLMKKRPQRLRWSATAMTR